MNDVCSMVYECTRVSKSRDLVLDYDVQVDRWECLLEKNDEAQLWCVINCRRQVSFTSIASSVPSPPTDV